jgi:hypothetical protein
MRLHQGERWIFVKAWRFASRMDELRPGAHLDVAVSIDADTFGAKRGFAGWGATLRDARPVQAL